jgi:hypothetical protein
MIGLLPSFEINPLDGLVGNLQILVPGDVGHIVAEMGELDDALTALLPPSTISRT